MKNIFFAIALLIGTTELINAQSGITWSPAVNVASSSSGNLHPRIVLDAAGNPLILWGHANRAMFSKWNGTSFTTPVLINPGAVQVFAASWAGPDIASNGDTVYVVYKVTPEDTNHIFLSHSYDGGNNFSATERVDFIGDSACRFPTVAVDESGNPVVAFMKFNTGFIEARWAVTKSTDFGFTFTPDVPANVLSGGQVCDCCPGSILSNANQVFMEYRNNLSNIRDMWAGVSSDYGNTFANAMQVDQGNWMLMACPSSGPDATLIGDSLYTVYMSGTTGNSLVYLSSSSVTSLNNSTGRMLTGNFTGLSEQNYPRVSSDGNSLAVVWKQTVSGQTQLALKYSPNITLGFPGTYDTIAFNNVTNTDVAMANGTVYVVWEDDNSGTVKFRKGTAPVITSIESDETENMDVLFPNPVNNGFVQYKVKGNSDTNATVGIFDMFGRKVSSVELQFVNDILNIDVDHLSAGTYILKINSGNKSYREQIVKY